MIHFQRPIQFKRDFMPFFWVLILSIPFFLLKWASRVITDNNINSWTLFLKLQVLLGDVCIDLYSNSNYSIDTGQTFVINSLWSLPDYVTWLADCRSYRVHFSPEWKNPEWNYRGCFQLFIFQYNLSPDRVRTWNSLVFWGEAQEEFYYIN
jgi:hypothetical protein